MPTYVSECQICGTKHHYIRSIKNREDTPPCCGEKTKKIIVAVNINGLGAFENYKCPETGQIVTSNKQRAEIMAKHDLVDARETGSAKDHINRAKKKQQKINESLNDDNVSVEYTDLSTA